MSEAKAFSSSQVRDAAPLFAALGDETRLRLLVRLAASGPNSISGLSARANVTRQAVRKHLEVLARAGLVRGSREGREHIWQLEPKRFVDARAYLDEISAQWDEALASLKRFVEADRRK